MPKHIDITGGRFGKLVAVEYVHRGRWLCKCDCGGSRICIVTRLVRGATTHCGCIPRTSETFVKFNVEQGKRRRAAHLSNYEVAKSGCWIWQGASFTDGYGKCGWFGKTRRAHRVFYEVYKGAIPEGLLVLHKCDTPLCVNPDHLWLGTQNDNSRDMISKGRQPPNPALMYPERLKRGDDNHMRQEKYRSLRRGKPPTNRKLIPSDVAEIVRSNLTTKELAVKYDVSISHITSIRRGYTHVCKE